MMQGLQNQMSTVIASALGDLQTTATAIAKQVSTDISCATVVTANVQDIMTQAASGVQFCVTNATTNLYQAFTDLVTISNLTTQIQQEVQAAQNLWNVFSLPSILANMMSQVAQITKTLPGDIATLTTGIPNAMTQIPTCANNVATAAGQQLNNILVNAQSCIQSG